MARGMVPACRDNRPRSSKETIEKQPQTASLRRTCGTKLRFDAFRFFCPEFSPVGIVFMK